MKRLFTALGLLLLAALLVGPALADAPISALPSGGLVNPLDVFPAYDPTHPGQDFGVTFGSAASYSVGTSGPTIGLLNTTNTWSAPQSFLSGDLIAADADFIGGAITLPAGATSARPASPVNGMLRYNTTTAGFEGYVSGTWGPIGGAGSTFSLTSPGPGIVLGTSPWTGGTTTISLGPPGVSTYGAIFGASAATTNQFVTYIDTSGNQHTAQVNFSNVAGSLPLSSMASMSANTVLGETASGTPIQLALPSCSGASNALIYTTGTGFGCNSISAGGSMVYPGTGIGNSTGSAWGTSYSVTGTGNVLVAAVSPVFTATPKINLNAASLPAAQTGTVLQVGNADSTATRIEADGFGASAYFSGIRKDGTNASPTTLQSGDEIGGFNGWGYNGTAVVGPQASFRTFAKQNWSVGANGTYADIAATPNGSTTLTEVAYFSTAGIGVGTQTPNSSLDISQKTDAVSLPSGTSAQRPSSVAGMIRYNSDATPTVEAYVNGIWQSLSGLTGNITYTGNHTVNQGDMNSQVNGTGTWTLTIPPISSTILPAHTYLCLNNEGSGTISVSSTPTINLYTGNVTSTTVGSGQMLCMTSNGASLDSSLSSGGGGSSQWTTSGSNIYYTTGGVDIGTTTGAGVLNVQNTTSGDGNEILALYDSVGTKTADMKTGGWFNINVNNGSGSQIGSFLVSEAGGTTMVISMKDSAGNRSQFGPATNSGGLGFAAETGSSALASTQLVIAPGGNVGIGSTGPVVSLDDSQKTDAIALPSGTSAQRPSPANGMIRYNQSTTCVEAYYSGAWNALGSSGGTAVNPVLLPYSQAPDTTGNVYPATYTGSGGNNAGPESAYAIAASFSTDGNLYMRFRMPPSIPSTGSLKLISVCQANTASATLKYTVQDADVAPLADPSAATLNSETQTSIAWSTGNASEYIVTMTALTETPQAGHISVVAVTYNHTGSTNTVPVDCNFAETWQ
jgi:hypothetical protein